MAMGRLWMTDWGWWGVGRQDPRPTRWIEHHRHNILSIIIIVIGTIVVIIVKIQGQRAITNISHRSHRSANRSARTKVSLDCPNQGTVNDHWSVRESEKVHNKSRHLVPKNQSLEVVHRETWFVDILSPGHPVILLSSRNLVIKSSLPQEQGYCPALDVGSRLLQDLQHLLQLRLRPLARWLHHHHQHLHHHHQHNHQELKLEQKQSYFHK